VGHPGAGRHARADDAVQVALKSSELKADFAREGAVTSTMTTSEFGDFIRAEIVKWGRVVKDGDIRAH